MATIRPIGAEVAAPILLGSATTLSNAKVFRAVNTATAAALVTIVDADDNLVGSMTLVAGGSVLIDKTHTDKVYASANTVLLSPLQFPRG